MTINPSLVVDQYPLPKPEDLFSVLSSGQKFSKLDLACAYQQLCLDKKSKDYVTINTHRGLYRYTRIPFGVASAPAIFQRVMEQILQGVPGVVCYLDDILIISQNDQKHYKSLQEVMKRLQESGLQLNSSKCKFLESSVEYLGFRISHEGLSTSQAKVEAVQKAPTPRNVVELRSFLGLVNYYGRFIPKLANICYPSTNY